MDKLSYLEICDLIAGIEWLPVTVDEEAKKVWRNDTGSEYNPLTDDALCFQLMVKYSIDLTHDFSGLWCASMNPSYTYDEHVENYGIISYDKNPNKAICLAIIEAHKESM